MPFKDLAAADAREVIPGFYGRFAHTDHATLAYWEVDAGAALPEHAHPHEQITLLIEGTFEMTVGGQTQTIEAGGSAAIPANMLHGGTAITACRIVDVFHPARDDYR